MTSKSIGRQTVHDYVVVLKNHNTSIIERTGWLLSLFFILPFFTAIYQSPKELGLYLSGFVMAALLLSNLAEKRKGKTVSFRLILIVAGCGIQFFSHIPYLGFLYLLAGIVEKPLLKKTEFGFSKEGIIRDGLFPKRIEWNSLSNVVIRGNLLTMDYKDNHLFQAETDDTDDEEYEVEDEEFNDYCRERIMDNG